MSHAIGRVRGLEVAGLWISPCQQYRPTKSRSRFILCSLTHGPRDSTDRAKGITHVWNSIYCRYLQHLALESRAPADPFLLLGLKWHMHTKQNFGQGSLPNTKCWCLQLNLSLCGNVPQAPLPSSSACWRLFGGVKMFAFSYFWIIIHCSQASLDVEISPNLGSLCTYG